MAELYLAKRSDGLLEAADDKTQEYIDGMPYRPEKFITTEIRGLSANAISHVWYGEIAKQAGDSAANVRCSCKLRLGVPILRAEDPMFRSFYDAVIKHLTYEQKLKVMVYVPVTSIMNKGQMSKYLDAMKIDAYENGFTLTEQ